METNVNYTVVGTFVIVLLCAIIFGIIWLSSGFSFQHYKTYKLYMQESVNGLNIDSPVEYNGVNVGSVKSIQINHKNPQLVEVLVNISTSTPVTRGTVATLSTRGITGITYVALKDRSTDLRPLESLPGQVYPVIPTTPSLFMRMDTALNEITTDIRNVSEAVQTLLNKDNQESIRETLANLKVFTRNLAENNARLTAILENSAVASRQLKPLLQSSTSAMRALESQTLPTAYQVLVNLQSMSRSLAETAAEIKENPAILIRGVDRQGLGPGETR